MCGGAAAAAAAGTAVDAAAGAATRGTATEELIEATGEESDSIIVSTGDSTDGDSGTRSAWRDALMIHSRPAVSQEEGGGGLKHKR